jgi:alginate O-acetyltransferase complex protein AlgI
MLFNSYPFILVFLPLSLIGYYYLAKINIFYSAVWLGLASICFYGYWSLSALPILLVSVGFNYFISIKVSDETHRHRQRWLAFAIAGNLLLLFYYKYINFGIQNVNLLLDMMQAQKLQTIPVILPIGISFFTFTQIVFLLDCYQGIAKEQRFSHYLLFVTFFPHLISGPVIHHKQMMPQFADKATYRLDTEKFKIGLTLLALGMAKKLLLADPISEFANVLYNSDWSQGTGHPAPHFIISWFGSLAYTMQMYFDFSGYSDMAVGISLLFGILLPINFNSPYRATSIIDFWQRWHMSLTRYIGQYLYNPLTLKFTRVAMAKPPEIEVLYSLVIPTLVVFIIVGIWHGANWTYVAFGTFHGVLLVINHLWRKAFGVHKKNKQKTAADVFKATLGWALTFFSVNACNVMFRATSFSQAISIYKGMIGLNGAVWPHSVADRLGWYAAHVGNIWGVDDIVTLKYVLLMLASFAIIFFLPSTATLTVRQKGGFNPIPLLTSRWVGASLGLLFAIAILSLKQNSPFLYFQF